MKLLQIDEILKQAEKRNLTLFGKVCIIKSLALSKIIYVATCISVPEKVIKIVDQKIFKFFWGKRDRIKRKSVINSIEYGGLAMIDINAHIKAMKAAWACRIANAPESHIWSYLPKFCLSKFLPNDLYHQ